MKDLEKQYVLSEKEYLTLCNNLESISVDLSSINRKLTIEKRQELKPLLISIDSKASYLMENLGWR